MKKENTSGPRERERERGGERERGREREREREGEREREFLMQSWDPTRRRETIAPSFRGGNAGAEVDMVSYTTHVAYSRDITGCVQASTFYSVVELSVPYKCKLVL